MDPPLTHTVQASTFASKWRYNEERQTLFNKFTANEIKQIYNLLLRIGSVIKIIKLKKQILTSYEPT